MLLIQVTGICTNTTSEAERRGKRVIVTEKSPYGALLLSFGRRRRLRSDRAAPIASKITRNAEQQLAGRFRRADRVLSLILYLPRTLFFQSKTYLLNAIASIRTLSPVPSLCANSVTIVFLAG